jgi:uncharacterized protein (TIGR00369 family)
MNESGPPSKANSGNPRALPPEVEALRALGEDAYFAALRGFAEQGIAFNAWLGIKVGAIARGSIELLMPFRPELVGDPWRPALHGGTLATLADAAGGLAVFTAAAPGDRVSTIDFRIDYLRPAALVPTTAEAKVVRMGNRVGVARIRILQEHLVENAPEEAADEDPQGRRIVAESTAVYSVRRL